MTVTFAPARVTWLGVDMKSTAYHEAVPGHHFQITIQQESQELPRYRKLGVFGFNSAYIEGWALYASGRRKTAGMRATCLDGSATCTSNFSAHADSWPIPVCTR